MPGQEKKTKGTAAATNAVRISKWYKADDEKQTRRNPAKQPKPTTLRKNITPGQILILLVGRFKGKRVVFLRQLKSGLLLVTGPYKINGVPLRRVNQTTVIPTSTKVELGAAKLDQLTDDFFKRIAAKRTKRSEDTFFQNKEQEKTEEEKKAVAARRKAQTEVDTPLLATIKKTELLRQYLRTRFTISKNTRPHELVF